MKKKIKRILLLCLSLCLLLQVSAAAFWDVPAGDWYADELDTIMEIQQMMGSDNIISGFPDGSFKPQGTLTRGQFLKLIFEAEMSAEVPLFTTDKSRDHIHWAGKYYTLALENNILLADVYSSSEPMFPCTWASLETPVSRYEMAVILNNITMNIVPGKTVIVNEPEVNITDYANIADIYKTAVEQAYGKGYLTGYEDGSFGGNRTLSRAEAIAVVYRYLFGAELADFAEEPKVENTSASGRPAGFVSFAEWLRSGHVDAWGKIDAEARIRLFGDANKSYFSSASDAAGYMETVTIPIWTMDKTGNKFSSSMPVTVHREVAQEVLLIFQQIYNDPERFPIYGGWSVGGARYTDTMRHSWGCAIDVNALYNCECNLKSGYLKVTCGYGWWPVGHADSSFAGSMTAPSHYSIGKNAGEYGYSVVKAFADYGWGWGGNGWSGGKSFDYMHFSVLPSGG